MPAKNSSLRPISVEESDILDVHYINVEKIERHGGCLFLDESGVFCRIPKGASLADACHLTAAMSTLSPEAYVVAPEIETEDETGDVLLRLAFSDVPKLQALINGEISYERALED